MDFGYHETTVIPVSLYRGQLGFYTLIRDSALQVFNTRIISHPIVSTPISSSSFFDRLKILLRHHSTLTPLRTPQRKPRSGKVEEVPEEDYEPRRPKEDELTRDVLEDVRSRGYFVGGVITQPRNVPADSSQAGATEEEQLATRLEHLYSHTAHSNTVDTVFTIPLPSKGTLLRSGVLKIPGWVRERAAEAYFEMGNEDQLSVHEAVLTCLSKVCVKLPNIIGLFPAKACTSIAPHRPQSADDQLHTLHWRRLYASRLYPSSSHFPPTSAYGECG